MDLGTDNNDKHEAFVALYVRHQAAIQSFVLALVPDFAAAEDIVQQASLTMWRKFDQYQEGTSFRNWAFQIAKFTTMNYQTKMKRSRLVFSDELLDILADEGKGRAEELEAKRRAVKFCVSKLMGDEQTMLNGCYKEGGSIKQFAKNMGLTVNTVYKRLNKVRINLLKCAEHRIGMES